MERQKIETYEQAVEYLLGIPRFTSKNTVEDTRAFLERLGSPDKKMKILHVAGTNGKGSVCAYLRYMLEEAGYAVCVFTSPHLVEIRERFLLCGEMVSREKFLRAFLAVYDSLSWGEATAADFYHPTFFEFLFFMAMLLFEEAKPDYCILETGLGGRLDATNSVSHKDLAVITRIGLDHVEYLGDTLEQIAAEKAGIIAPKTPVVYTAVSDSVNAVFDETAKKNDAISYRVSKKDYTFLNFANKNIDFSLHTRYYNDISLTLRTTALYQMENAALAVRALEELDRGSTVTARQIREGLRKCFWPARMEEVLPGVYVDGAHNEDGVRAFLETVAASGGGKKILLFSAVQDKAYDKMLERIMEAGLFDTVCLTAIKSGRAAEPEKLREQAEKFLPEDQRVRIRSFCDAKQALKTLLSEKEPDQQMYIAGSLYLAGEVKAYLGVLK